MTCGPECGEGHTYLRPCEMASDPKRPPSPDGIYPRCVWCNGENYGPAVLDYSRGAIPCAAVDGCGQFLPAEYIDGDTRFTEDDDGNDDIANQIGAELLLESHVAQHMLDDFTSRDPKFRVGDRKYRLACYEELPEKWADNESIYLIEPATGRLYEVEIEVMIRELHLPIEGA